VLNGWRKDMFTHIPFFAKESWIQGAIDKIIMISTSHRHASYIHISKALVQNAPK
jgi:hypothetical protein